MSVDSDIQTVREALADYNLWESERKPSPEPEKAFERLVRALTDNASDVCPKCGKGWPEGLSGAVSSMTLPGRFEHFPNCPGESPPNG